MSTCFFVYLISDWIPSWTFKSQTCKVSSTAFRAVWKGRPKGFITNHWPFLLTKLFTKYILTISLGWRFWCYEKWRCKGCIDWLPFSRKSKNFLFASLFVMHILAPWLNISNSNVFSVSTRTTLILYFSLLCWTRWLTLTVKRPRTSSQLWRAFLASLR